MPGGLFEFVGYRVTNRSATERKTQIKNRKRNLNFFFSNLILRCLFSYSFCTLFHLRSSTQLFNTGTDLCVTVPDEAPGAGVGVSIDDGKHR